MKLTKATLKAIEATDKDIFLWDDTLQGFGVRIKPTGVKSYLIQYRNENGQSRRATVGRDGVLTLDEARKKAKALLGRVANGADPREEVVEKRSAVRFDDMTKRFLKEHCATRCKPHTVRNYETMIDRHLVPAFGTKPLASITRADIAALHTSMAEIPRMANLALSVLSSIFNRAIEWGVLDEGQNPVKRVKGYPEKPKQRFLVQDEIKRLGKSIQKLEEAEDISPYVAAAFRLLVATGARHDEIRTLKWEDVHLDRGIILLDEHKTSSKGAKVIPLNATSRRILEGLTKVSGNPYVIVGVRAGQPYINLHKAWRRVRADAKLEDVRIHDLRHTFASQAIAEGASLPVIGALLGHRSVQSTAVYAHLAVNTLKDATEKVSDRIGGMI
ncbi:tyrosine-type recombinase/integrase [Gimibacter soli]|uniref:Site-specific integrase n=1 Tax=Gimibacter soli TaxID=3024400 RepID=A0AAE9XSJ8_9PROT|nr:site-specific integrase [Gimibacter soli]WCL55541.1 site-specific integrase [Gimibacter soli]